MSSKNKFLNSFRIFARIFTWIFGTLAPIHFGYYVYAREYLSESAGTLSYAFGGYKRFLDQTINFSWLGIFITISLVLSIIFKILKEACDYLIDLDEKVVRYEAEIDSLKSRINTQINENIVNDDKEKIVEIMEKYCLNNPEVIGIQLYQCRETKAGKRQICYEFLATEYSYTSNNDMINSIHEKYLVNKESISQYLKIKGKYLKGNTEALNNYIKMLTDRLKHKETKEITNAMINDYCFLVLAFQLMLGDVQFEIEDLSRDFQDKINSKKRTGLLRGVIEQDYYKFIHTGRSDKNNRVYLTNCIDIRNTPHIVVITFKPDVVKRAKYAEVIDNIGETFCNILERDSKIVYNNYRVS